jgi:hypothetical protein
MLMLCWFYCLPLAKFVYFALGFLLVIFAVFMLRRGIRQNRLYLRQTALFLMFVALFKVSIFDIRMLERDILCAADQDFCSRGYFMAFEAFGLLLLAGGSVFLFRLYKKFLQEKRQPLIRPEDVRLGMWSKAAIISVVIMAIWQLAPWAGFLTVGYVPQIFVVVPWSVMSLACLAIILTGFWKAESCSWDFDATGHRKQAFRDRSWTPRDTLWMAFFVYLITLALSYAGHDVLAGNLPR